MATNKERNETIRYVVMQRAELHVDGSILLWELLAAELISIIGEGGFQSIYARSIHLTGATYPWILSCVSWQEQPESRFNSLRKSFDGREFHEASEANITLLFVFFDILAMLIGEILTTNILRSAWGDDAFNSADKGLTK